MFDNDERNELIKMLQDIKSMMGEALMSQPGGVSQTLLCILEEVSTACRESLISCPCPKGIMAMNHAYSLTQLLKQYDYPSVREVSLTLGSVTRACALAPVNSGDIDFSLPGMPSQTNWEDRIRQAHDNAELLINFLIEREKA